MSGHLNPGGQQFRGDRGAAEPRVTAALAAFQAGQGSEQAALTALAASRLLVPVIAVLAEGTAAEGTATEGTATEGTAAEGTAAEGTAAEGTATDRTAPADGTAPADSATAKGDKDSEMMLPTLIGRDGRPAVIAFTGVDALARWRPNARPVPAEAGRVWRAAAADGCAVVIDVAGPVPLAVEGARLAALAAGQPVPPPHEDPDVRAEIQAAVAAEPAIAGFTLAPGRQSQDRHDRPDRKDRHGRQDPQDGPDLAVTLHLAKNEPAKHKGPAVNRAAAQIAARLGTRLSRGIEVIVAG